MKQFAKRAQKPGKTLQSFIATGSLVSKTGCGLGQITGNFII